MTTGQPKSEQPDNPAIVHPKTVITLFPLSLTILALSFLCLGALAGPAVAQTGVSPAYFQSIEDRLNVLERTVNRFPTQIQEFHKRLSDALDADIQSATGKSIVLDLHSQKFSKINTNAGFFLVSVQGKQKIDNGYRLTLHNGNPYAVDFSGVTLSLKWGRQWKEGASWMGYDQWRDSLKAARYKYDGDLAAGEWTEILVDVTPVGPRELEYAECSMTVAAVKMLKK